MSEQAIVVGAGVFGAATADALARRGWRVTIVERYAPANARGSSGDRTRLLRAGHGDTAVDDWYTHSALHSAELWRELSAEAPAPLTQTTGLTWLAGEGDPMVAAVRSGLARAGASHEWLGVDDLRALFPSLEVTDLAGALFEPDAAIIRATDAVLALLRRAERRGARLIVDRASPSGKGQIAIGAGTLGGDAVVWACGAWMGDLLGVEAPIRPAWQDVAHWHCPPEWARAPAFFEPSAGIYGFPDVDGLGLKALSHEPGRSFDLDRDARSPDPATIASLSRYVRRRFPALDGSLLAARVMPYEMTRDGNFVVGASQRWDGHWVLGGGSGHGFKHAPVLGEHVADLIEGRAEQLPQFAPGRFSSG